MFIKLLVCVGIYTYIGSVMIRRPYMYTDVYIHTCAYAHRLTQYVYTQIAV
uniref:Uncharacterized protein n=1 Tax=Anguilla anguilla TaxID=7936 RepID=A0A0E9WNM6_ANGAN